MHISNSPSALDHRVNQITAFCMFTNQIGPLIFICCKFRSVHSHFIKLQKQKIRKITALSMFLLFRDVYCIRYYLKAIGNWRHHWRHHGREVRRDSEATCLPNTPASTFLETFWYSVTRGFLSLEFLLGHFPTAWIHQCPTNLSWQNFLVFLTITWFLFLLLFLAHSQLQSLPWSEWPSQPFNWSWPLILSLFVPSEPHPDPIPVTDLHPSTVWVWISGLIRNTFHMPALESVLNHAPAPGLISDNASNLVLISIYVPGPGWTLNQAASPMLISGH